MKLVIDIPKKTYEQLKFLNEQGEPRFDTIIDKAVANGIPLPKGHGRLIDADALWKKWVFDAIGKQEIDEAPTIIKADKENEECR